MLLEKILATVSNLASGQDRKIYLVGGFLRDLYLGLPGFDLDFAVTGDALGFARTAAEILKGTFVPLDGVNGVARVIIGGSGCRWQADFSALKGRRLEEDLSGRDFTVNAMAIELPDYLKIAGLSGGSPDRRDWHGLMIDPHGGLADIENKVIRATGDCVFESDPVRILRGVRLAGKLGFVIRPETVELMKRSRRRLQETAGERIWEELLAILALPDSYRWIAMLDSTEVLPEIFPFVEKMKATAQNNFHRDNVWTHSLNTYRRLEEIYLENGFPGTPNAGPDEDLKKRLRNHLDRPLRHGRGRRCQLLKLAALFHDAGKADTAGVREDGRITFPDHHNAGLVYASRVSQRLKTSKAEKSYLENMVMHHMYPLYLFINQPAGPADTRKFFNRLGENAPDVLLLSHADVTATYQAAERGKEAAEYRAFTGDLLHRYFFEAETYVHIPPFVKGTDLIECFGLKPSRKVGSLLKEICGAQMRGEVNSREEALAYAARLLKEKA
ncbi:MAG TPA: HD domain-containing protein [Bacillota bacterium]|nr:HD domain-containing protein [Bacillota bacterium]